MGKFVRAGAAMSAGVAGTALLATGAPAALAASNATTAADLEHGSSSPGTRATTGVGQAVAPAFGLGKHMTESLNPTSIPADGASTSQVTADVFTFQRINGQKTRVPASCFSNVVFTSSDPGETVGATSLSGPGTYTATITASTTPGQATITAKCPVIGGTLFAHATLTQTGPMIGVIVTPSSIRADGKSTSTGTCTVTNSSGKPKPGDTVTFTSSDSGEKFSAVTDHGDGTYSVIINASKAVETATITCTDTTVDPHLSATASLTQTSGPSAVQVAVPATGSASTTAGVVGALFMALGGGLFATARRCRRLANRLPG